MSSARRYQSDEAAARERNLGPLRRHQWTWVRQELGERERLRRKVRHKKLGEGKGTRRRCRVKHKAIGERKGHREESGQRLR